MAVVLAMTVLGAAALNYVASRETCAVMNQYLEAHRDDADREGKLAASRKYANQQAADLILKQAKLKAAVEEAAKAADRVHERLGGGQE